MLRAEQLLRNASDLIRESKRQNQDLTLSSVFTRLIKQISYITKQLLIFLLTRDLEKTHVTDEVRFNNNLNTMQRNIEMY